MLTLGSLFDGIGVFPLAAQMNGITPVWASEIEAAPIYITKRHFPDMLHLGDITKLHGGEIPAVDVITFGSPCQNISTLGNHTGLYGPKSSLFFQAIRIIQEMRDATNHLFPTIAVWENVSAALFSGHRLDYLAVLRAFTASEIPMPASQYWAAAGMVRGTSPDVAWRLMDAQHWASPRLARRQRVFLVADFGGRRAHEILFRPRQMQRDFTDRRKDRLSPAAGDRGSFIEARGRVPVVYPFQSFRMRSTAETGSRGQYLGSFGRPTDPFPTLITKPSDPFAFWYEDDPLGGCIRFLTETESERAMGLPEGWTASGAGGVLISSSARYKALGNAIALPCANYIMAGIKEALDG